MNGNGNRNAYDQGDYNSSFALRAVELMKSLECSQHYRQFFRRARADSSGVGGGIWLKFELIQALMHVLVTCNNQDDRIQNEGARVFTRFPPLSVYGDFSRCPRAANSAVLGPIWPNFEFVRDVMDVLVTCKYEEDPIKNEGVRVFTTFSPLYSYGSYRLPWTPEF